MPYLFASTFRHLHAFSSTSVLHPLNKDNIVAVLPRPSSGPLQASFVGLLGFFYEVDITDVSGYQLHKASVFSHGGPGAQLGHEHCARLPFLGGSVLQS